MNNRCSISKILIVCLVSIPSSIFLTGCTPPSVKYFRNKVPVVNERLMVLNEETERETRRLQKSYGVKYISTTKDKLLQAFSIALMKSGFHLDNQDSTMGFIRASAAIPGPIESSDLRTERQLVLARLDQLMNDEYADRGVFDMFGIVLTELKRSVTNRAASDINDILVTVILLERSSDVQANISISYKIQDVATRADNPGLEDLGIADYVSVKRIYAFPISLHERLYMHIWDKVEKTLFEQGVILNR